MVKVLIYQGTKAAFMDNLEQDMLANQLKNLIYEKMKRKTHKNEYKSWENSMQYMYKVLNDDDIPQNSGVAIEYNIPNTSKRIDFLLSGFNENEKGNTVVIELKQWEDIELVKEQDGLVQTYVGNAFRKVVHPSYHACLTA